MLKRINKISRRLGKKRDKGITASPSKSDLGDEGLSGKGSSLPDLSGNSNGGIHKSSSGKSLDACNNETNTSDYEVTETIPVTASSEESLLDKDEESDMWIPIEELRNVYLTRHADEDRLFREETKALSSYVARNAQSCDYAKLPQNKEKNRYKNIVTYDKSRVILKRMDDDPFSDYINASYINGYTKKRKFIATQGPKPSTVNDFWRMVWEQKCVVIVMVTDFRESGKQKCEKYFPEEGGKEYGKFHVASGPVTSYGGYHQRTITMRLKKEAISEDGDAKGEDSEKADEDTRQITHLQCKRWPDHGVPKTTSAIFRLYRKMNECQPPDCDAPILVHCSAGVGRTGTLIGLDFLVDQLAAEKRINIHDAVVEMRRSRTEMVQSMDQYVLLHKLILEHHYIGDTDCGVAEFEEKMEELDQIDEETEKSGFESQFDQLSFVPPQNARLGSGSLTHNASKNRDEKIIPYEHSQVFIRMRPTEMRPPYVNASTLLGYDDSVKLIAAQDPLPDLLEDFWRVIIDNNATCIVMLTPQTKDDVEYCPQYWPSDDVLEFGDITIKLEESIDHGEYCETRLTILTDDREKLGRSVTHLHFKGWAEDEPPPPHAETTILEIVAQVDKHKRAEERSNSKVLVHCSDGAGHTGAFCAIVNIVERLKCENRVDVFRAIKDLRDCRPGMVKTVDEYKFCHEAIATYLRSFDLYSNGTKL